MSQFLIRFYLVFITFNIIFSDIWISKHLSAEYDIKYSTGYDSSGKYEYKGLSIGYEDMVYRSFMLGFSYDFKSMRDNYSIKGASFSSLYIKYILVATNSLSIWTVLGRNYPKKDIKYYNNDILYGIGVKLKNGIGINYIIYELTQDSPDINNMTSTGFINRYSLSYSF